MDLLLKAGFPLVAPFVLQLGVALTGLIGLTFAPPAQGRMLLVPLTASARAQLPIAAFGHHALLLGSGPFRGSLVVTGGPPSLVWTMLRLGVLPVAASPAGCGPFTDGASPA